MRDVKDKVAFITGGASGIGLGIGKAFVNAGMKVILADVREDHLENAMAEFKAAGQEDAVHTLKLDVTDRKAMAAAADEAETIFGKIHVLVNNAGVGILGPLKQAKYDDWDWGLEVHLGGVINGVTEFLPKILSHGEGGHIINTCSKAAIMPIAGASIYITAKSAVLGLSEAMHTELAEDNIGVSGFCPGPVATNLGETLRLRPERYRQDSGYVEFEAQRSSGERPRRTGAELWMSIEEVGERVLEGMRNNEIFILTHREFKEGVAERCEALLAAFPDEEINEKRAEAISFLLSNPIYEKNLKAKGKR